MRYIAKLLDNVQNVNSFNVVDQLTVTRGMPSNLYFQLMTLTESGSTPGKTRYVSQATSLQVEAFLDNFDNDLVIERVAVRAFTGANGDGSIFYIPILQTDDPAPNSMRLIVTEDNVPKVFTVESELRFSGPGARTRLT